jgi:hypothetical protein
MLNYDYELYEEPFPHIIIKDFIRDTALVDYLANNTHLSDYMQDFSDGQRVACYSMNQLRAYDSRDKLTHWTTALDSHKGVYGIYVDGEDDKEFRLAVENVSRRIIDDQIFWKILRKEFEPYLEKEYHNYGETWETMFRESIYGAYNKTSVAKQVIGWHLDNGNKLLSGFVYLKEDGDLSEDSELYLTDGKDRLIKEIPYENNLMIIWPNLRNSWHKAGVRWPTEHLRRLIQLNLFTSQRTMTGNDLYYHTYQTEKTKTVDETNIFFDKIFGIKDEIV